MLSVQAVLQQLAQKGNIKKITELLNQDARYTVRDLVRLANFSLARFLCILRKNLKLRKIRDVCKTRMPR